MWSFMFSGKTVLGIQNVVRGQRKIPRESSVRQYRESSQHQVLASAYLLQGMVGRWLKFLWRRQAPEYQTLYLPWSYHPFPADLWDLIALWLPCLTFSLHMLQTQETLNERGYNQSALWMCCTSCSQKMSRADSWGLKVAGTKLQNNQ